MRKVLIIDDDLDLQRLYSEKLRANGFEVTLAANSDQALQEINSQLPGLILLDVMIPGKMNGLELLKMFKSSDGTKDIPVLVLTNLDNQKADALNGGADDYVVKVNISLNDLLEKVKKLIR